MADLDANMDGNPSFDCVGGHHLFYDIHDPAGLVVGGWCPWCGTGAYDPDRITEDGRAVGFEPDYRVRIPAGFSRSSTGAR